MRLPSYIGWCVVQEPQVNKNYLAYVKNSYACKYRYEQFLAGMKNIKTPERNISMGIIQSAILTKKTSSIIKGKKCQNHSQFYFVSL